MNVRRLTTAYLFTTHLFVMVIAFGALTTCIHPLSAQDRERRRPVELQITSTAFQEGQAIPPVYTADGQNKSPPLKWKEPPAGTKVLALLCEDPDAPKGTFTHWVAFNIPAETRELSEGLPKEQKLANGTVQGKNDMGLIGYAGPAPPRGRPHHYQFELFALDTSLGLPPDVSAKDVRAAISGHVLAEGRLTGTYGRK